MQGGDGYGWPSPSDHSAADSSSCWALSTLLATRITGLLVRRSIRTAASSSSSAPTVESTTKQDHVGGLGGDLGLRGDRGGPVPGVRLPATGVHHGEAAPGPLGVVGDPVPGHPGYVLDHGLPPTEDPVDQCGLTHVGPAHDGDHRGRAER